MSTECYYRAGKVYLSVPDGMTVGEATERLARPADDEWVPWPAEKWGQEPDGARCRDEWTEGARARVQRYIHPDDLPQDPDADLVEAIAEERAERYHAPLALLDLHEEHQSRYREDARAALAVVREHEVQR